MKDALKRLLANLDTRIEALRGPIDCDGFDYRERRLALNAKIVALEEMLYVVSGTIYELEVEERGLTDGEPDDPESY
jgi:hypothetical protein